MNMSKIQAPWRKTNLDPGLVILTISTDEEYLFEGFSFSFIYLYWENFRYIYGIPVFKTAQLTNDYKLTTLHIII